MAKYVVETTVKRTWNYTVEVEAESEEEAEAMVQDMSIDDIESHDVGLDSEDGSTHIETGDVYPAEDEEDDD